MRVRYILGRECGGTSPAVAFVCCVVYRQCGLSNLVKKMFSWVEFCLVYFSLYGGVQSKVTVFGFSMQAGVSGDSVLLCSSSNREERCNTAVGPPSHRHVRAKPENTGTAVPVTVTGPHTDTARCCHLPENNRN